MGYRLKTINRREPYNKKESLKSTNEKPATVASDKSDFKDDIRFLNSACPSSQRRDIFIRMKKTYPLRSFETHSILIDFPRFLDTPGLVSEYNRLLLSIVSLYFIYAFFFNCFFQVEQDFVSKFQDKTNNLLKVWQELSQKIIDISKSLNLSLYDEDIDESESTFLISLTLIMNCS